MFKRTPTLINTNQALVAAGGDVGDMGVTSRPVSTVMPDFQIVAQQKSNGWFAHVQLIREGAEGTNNSVYLAPGDYLSGKGQWQGNGIGPYNAAFCPQGEITGRVSPLISGLSRMAETEHCNDVLRAYSLTVGAANAALRAARDYGRFGPQSKRPALMREVRDSICHGLHARLARVFTNAIQIQAMVNRHRFATEMSALFLAVSDLTLGRDNNGNHTFVMGAAVQPHWLFGWFQNNNNQGDLRHVVQGPNFQVPGALTVNLINL